MSRYSSIASSSSRSVTKCSWLRSSRRSSPDSLTISIRAVSGCDRISDEIEVSVLKRKCGLIWLASASTRAAISSFSCSCSRCSIRALFQILIGTATHSTVARITSAATQGLGGAWWKSRKAPNRCPSPCRMISRPIGGGQQDDHPVDLEPPHQPPDVAVQVGEEQRREVPDRFFGAELAQAAAGEPAADREGERNPFPGDGGGNAHHRADDRAGVGPGQQPGEERARQRQVRRLVVEQEARDDAGGQRQAEAGGKDQPLWPVPLLGQQDPPEPREPHQHRRQHGHDGQLGHKGRQQELDRG